MHKIGVTVDIVFDVPDEVYQEYVYQSDLCDLYLLAKDYIRLEVAPNRQGVKLDWFEINYPEEID